MSRIDTKCVQAGYTPENGQAGQLPIYQSTTFEYDKVDTLGDLFDLKIGGHFYTRLSNPTNEAVENKINALEGGVGAMVTSAGQAASLIAVTNIASSGDHIISTAAVYGGTFNASPRISEATPGTKNYCAALNCKDGHGTIKVYGGSFKAFNPYNNLSETNHYAYQPEEGIEFDVKVNGKKISSNY